MQFFHAVIDGKTELVKELLETADEQLINGRTLMGRESALHLAIRHNRLAIVELLLACPKFTTDSINAQNSHGDTALHDASRLGHLTIMSALINAPRFESVNQINEAGQTALHEAVKNYKLSAVQLLLKAPQFTVSAINQVDHEGNSVLHLVSDQPQVAQLLLADHRLTDLSINRTNLNGQTVLHLVAGSYSASTDLLTILLDSPRITAQTVNARDLKNSTILHHCISAYQVKTKLPLILHSSKFDSASLNVQDTYGFTILHLLAMYNNQEIINYLLSEQHPFYSQFDLDLRNHHDQLAEDLADQVEIKELFQTYRQAQEFNETAYALTKAAR